jgi:hypothetical protein
MKILLNLLTSIYGIYKDLTVPKDYSVARVDMEYYLTPGMKYEVEDEFWGEESKHWDDLHALYTDVTGRSFAGTVVPQNVHKIIIRRKYWYGGRVYRMITTDIDAEFPPKEGKGMVFSIPLTGAWLCDADDKPVRCVTEKIRRCAGPKNDYHGCDVPLRDVLFYDEDMLREVYPKLMLQNALGIKRVFSTLDDSTLDLL